MFHSCSVLLRSSFSFAESDPICACSEPKLLEGYGLGDKNWQAGGFSYVDENNGIGVELVRQITKSRLSAEAAGTAKIGKCFHTGNIGFPLGEASFEGKNFREVSTYEYFVRL
jgi:hypothetical protein